MLKKVSRFCLLFCVIILFVGFVFDPLIVHAATIPECSTQSYIDRYPESDFPHAIGPNGCDLSRDSWPAPLSGNTVNFLPACDAHDRCYFDQDADFNACNERFARDLTDRCTQDLDSISGPFDTTLPNPSFPVEFSACTAIAATYYTGVQLGALAGFFESAQDKQREHDEWVATNCTIPSSRSGSPCGPMPTTSRRGCDYDCYSNGSVGTWKLVCNGVTPCRGIGGREEWCPAP